MIEIISIGHLPPSPGWRMKSHSHAAISELVIPVKGKMHLRYAEGLKKVGVGDIMLYSPECLHEEKSDTKDPVELIFLAFAGKLDDKIRIIPDDGGRIRQLARWLWEAHQGGMTDLKQAYCQVIFGEVSTLMAGKQKDDLILQARDYMRQNLNSLVSLEQLAAKANMSKFHFLRKYKSLAGVTPLDDFKSLRIRKAAELLQTTNLPLKAIADMTGFANEYHFSREFKKNMQQSPGEFRK